MGLFDLTREHRVGNSVWDLAVPGTLGLITGMKSKLTGNFCKSLSQHAGRMRAYQRKPMNDICQQLNRLRVEAEGYPMTQPGRFPCDTLERARTLREVGKYEEAIEVLVSCQAGSDWSLWMDYRALNEIGLDKFSLGDTVGAEKCLRRALVMSRKTTAYVFVNHATTLLSLGRLEEALSAAAEAQEHAPGDWIPCLVAICIHADRYAENDREMIRAMVAEMDRTCGAWRTDPHAMWYFENDADLMAMKRKDPGLWGLLRGDEA